MYREHGHLLICCMEHGHLPVVCVRREQSFTLMSGEHDHLLTLLCRGHGRLSVVCCVGDMVIYLLFVV